MAATPRSDRSFGVLVHGAGWVAGQHIAAFKAHPAARIVAVSSRSMTSARQRIAASGLSGVRGGFVHVPCLPEQVARHPGAPSMALATQVEALRVTIRTALAVQTDIAAVGGQLH